MPLTFPPTVDTLDTLAPPGSNTNRESILANAIIALQNYALNGAAAGGWVPTAVALTYSAADAPTFVATTASDLTALISVGMRVKLTQTTVKYFIVTAIDAATITLYGGTDYTLANAAISAVSFSSAKAPQGFPLDPAKWTVTTLGPIDALTALNTITNLQKAAAALEIVVPVGAWWLSIDCEASAGAVNAGGLPDDSVNGMIGLATVNNAFDTDELTGMFGSEQIGLTTVTTARANGGVHLRSSVIQAAKVTWFVNGQIVCNGGATSGFLNDNGQVANGLFVRALSAYL